MYYVGAIAGQLPSFLDKSDFYIGYGIAGYAASAYNLHLDYFMAINGDVVRISKTQISHDVVLQGSESYEVHDTSGVYEQLPVVGDIVELNPQGNIMWIMSSGVNLISQHYTIEHIDITPRYALL